MLKRKLVKTGFVNNGLLLIIAIVSVAATRLTVDTARTLNDSTIQQLNFDTTFLRLSGDCNKDALNIPAIGLNKNAEIFVNDYLAKNSRMLQKIKDKNPSWFTIMDSAFSKQGLPMELKYLAIVESKLRPSAVSFAGAAGAWQLMPSTARYLSLKVSAAYDERTHFYKSTVAAAKYLNYLHIQFGDWLLVIAAYNSGPGTVCKAIKKSGSRNFWKLQNYLPVETRMHVKKFIGTHYYFEKQGGVTTLTKEETSVYRKVMIAFVEEYNTNLKEKQAIEAISI